MADPAKLLRMSVMNVFILYCIVSYCNSLPTSILQYLVLHLL